MKNLFLLASIILCAFQVSMLQSLGFSQKIKDVSAILFSSSTGYYNYRQTANVLSIYHILKQNNIQDAEITLAIPQNSGCCEKNPLFGTVSFFDNQYQNINTDIKIDRQFSTINLRSVVNMLRNKYQPFTLNRLKRQKSRKLFIYLTGHGGDYYFKIRQREAILQDHFRIIFNQLQRQRSYESIMLLIDSCSGSTSFESVQAKNFIALASSSFDQKSLSHGWDARLNSAKSDDFSYYLAEYLKQNSLSHRTTTLKQLKNYMSFDKLRVNSKIVSGGVNPNQSINKYMHKDLKINRRKFFL